MTDQRTEIEMGAEERYDVLREMEKGRAGKRVDEGEVWRGQAQGHTDK